MEGPGYIQGEAVICSQFVEDNNNKTATAGGDHFIVEDLLDFSNDDDAVFTDGPFDNYTGSSTNSSSLTLVDSCNSSTFSGNCELNFLGDIGQHNFAAAAAADVNFPTDLCFPPQYDDFPELEWLSNVVEESFSTEDLEKLSLISGMNSRKNEATTKTREFQQRRPHDVNQSQTVALQQSELLSVPAKARSKRSRAAPNIWNSRLSVPSPSPSPSPTTSSSENDAVVAVKKKETADADSLMGNGEGRKCLHCATDKTPQWRTGPMGPKTLCNACGVRYKSGRLVPEYRPAASPTFVLTKHSNSHRKVLELRRQKEMMGAHHHHHQHQHQHQQQPERFFHNRQAGVVFDVSNDDDYLIHQQLGPNFG